MEAIPLPENATSDLFAEMDTRLSTEDAMTTREFADRVGKNST